MDKKIEALIKRKEKVLKAGGEDRIAKQHKSGKMPARERIEFLLDENSFVELNVFVEHHCTRFGMDSQEAPGDASSQATE